MNPLIGLLMGSVGALTGMQAGWRYGVLRAPRPMAKPLATWLDHPLRLRYRNPGETLGLYGLMGGMTVLDAGCGTGTYTAEMARMVGTTGIVHALDLQGSFLEQAQTRLVELNLANRVRFHHAGIYRMPIDDDSVDLVIMMSVLPEIPDRIRALAEIRRILKADGRVAVGMELWHPGYVPPSLVRRWLVKAGFRYAGTSYSPLAYDMIFMCHGNS